MSAHEITLPAPAKLNLFLHITGRRADGYHTLQTAFQFIDRADTLHFRLRHDGQLQLTADLDGVLPQDNLIIRAGVALRQLTGCTLGANITLEKRLPMGGGLGGGSSDAASTLLALNTLWETQLTLDELATLGLSLGADVPVFVHGHAAWAEGIGEQLTAIDPDEPWYVVLTPKAHVSTAEAFRHPLLTRHSGAIKLRDLNAGATRNDFEKVIRIMAPAVDEALQWLSQHGVAKMTGTGACVFLSCTSQGQAADILSSSPVNGFICRGQNRSPAHTALDQWLRMHRI
jgi:4-diphosphocytidyl-2-C-methyl-D-erythritol kinase